MCKKNTEKPVALTIPEAVVGQNPVVVCILSDRALSRLRRAARGVRTVRVGRPLGILRTIGREKGRLPAWRRENRRFRENNRPKSSPECRVNLIGTVPEGYNGGSASEQTISPRLAPSQRRGFGMFFSFVSWLRRQSAPARKAPIRRRVRLSVDRLEDRSVPAALPPLSVTNWAPAGAS